MPWLKLLHVASMIVWCGALLYLPAAVAQHDERGEVGSLRLVRRFFTLYATPAALLAIASGTAVFAWHGPLAPWLVVKLGLVALLVLVHAAFGVLILAVEERPERPRGLLCGAMGAAIVVLVLAILTLVVVKPT